MNEGMSEATPSPTGTSRRAKRAARACNHCRWKRLKCSDQSHGESCMNCKIYGTKCEYTAGWSSQGGSGKRKSESGGGSTSAPKVRKKLKTSMGGESADGAGEITPHSATADESSLSSRSPENEEPFDPEEGTEGGVDSCNPVHIVGESEQPNHHNGPNPNSVLIHDQLGKKLVHYLTPMMTGVDNDEDIALSAEDAGLPPEPIAEALVNAYFDNVAPLYPILDESAFRLQLQDYYSSVQTVDRLWLMLVKLVMCTGAASTHDAPSLGQDIKVLREALFMQVLSSAYLVYTQVRLKTSQILLLVALYCTQMKRPNSAWLWCRWAIRMSKGGGLHRERNVPVNLKAEPQALKDRVMWTLFILESQLSLSQFRDDPRFQESTLKQPSEEVKKKFPVFCYRLSLARIIHKFCKMGMDGSPDAAAFANVVDTLNRALTGWKESLPVGYQPDNDIFAESEEYQCVLLMHVEYYGLMLAMFTALGAASRLLPKTSSYNTHPSSRVRNQIAVRISNARRILHTIDTIADTAHLKPCVSTWITSVQILGPFSFIYSHVMRRPSLFSAPSDLELLYSASQHFRRYMADSPRNKNIALLITAMCNAASNFVNQARLNTSTSAGPGSAGAESLQNQFSDVPGAVHHDGMAIKNSNDINDYDYSPTGPPPIDPLVMVGNTTNLHPNHDFPFSPHGQGHDHYGLHEEDMPPILSAAEAAAMMAVQQQQQQHEYMQPGMTPYPDAIGAIGGNVGAGWDDWVWQNDMRPTSHG